MTVDLETAKSGPYTGDGAVTVFAYAFKALNEAHLVVTQTVIATGVETVKTLTTHYTVSGVGVDGGGNVTMLVAPPSTATLTISRAVTKSQSTDLVNRGAVQPESLETALDRGVQMTQDLEEVVDRSVRFAVSADLSSFNPDVPEPVASKAISINAAGTAFELVDTPTVAAAAAAASAAAALVSENAAAADLVLTNADVVLTNADVVLTNADVVLTNADVVLTNADVVLTNADVVLTNADVVTVAATAATMTGAASSTSLLIEVASKAFTVASGLGFIAGDWVLATSDAGITNYMHGQIASYTGTTMTVTVDNIGGSGTLADWTIRRSGTQGTTGNTGSTGSTGPTGATGPIGPVGVGLSLALGG